MIYSVVPKVLADELYARLAGYYEDDANVRVIIDRRKRQRRGGGPRGGAESRRELRDRRRARVAGDFPSVEAML